MRTGIGIGSCHFQCFTRLPSKGEAEIPCQGEAGGEMSKASHSCYEVPAEVRSGTTDSQKVEEDFCQLEPVFCRAGDRLKLQLFFNALNLCR